MYKNDKEKETPVPVQKLQLEVDVLLWASGIQKLLPNLPNGKKKELLKEQVDAILDNHAHPLRECVDDALKVLDKIRTDLSSVLTSKVNWDKDKDAKTKLNNIVNGVDTWINRLNLLLRAV